MNASLRYPESSPVFVDYDDCDKYEKYVVNVNNLDLYDDTPPLQKKRKVTRKVMKKKNK